MLVAMLYKHLLWNWAYRGALGRKRNHMNFTFLAQAWDDALNNVQIIESTFPNNPPTNIPWAALPEFWITEREASDDDDDVGGDCLVGETEQVYR